MCRAIDELCVIQYYKMFVATHKDKRKTSIEDKDSDNEMNDNVHSDISELESDIDGKFHYVILSLSFVPI